MSFVMAHLVELHSSPILWQTLMWRNSGQGIGVDMVERCDEQDVHLGHGLDSSLALEERAIWEEYLKQMEKLWVRF